MRIIPNIIRRFHSFLVRMIKIFVPLYSRWYLGIILAIFFLVFISSFILPRNLSFIYESLFLIGILSALIFFLSNLFHVISIFFKLFDNEIKLYLKQDGINLIKLAFVGSDEKNPLRLSDSNFSLGPIIKFGGYITFTSTIFRKGFFIEEGVEKVIWIKIEFRFNKIHEISYSINN